MDRLKKYYPLIRCICSVESKRLRDKHLGVCTSDDEFCRCIREVAKNTIKNFPLRKQHKQKIDRQSKIVKGILSKNKRTSKKFIKQSGGFLPLVLPFLASAIATAAGNALYDYVVHKNDGKDVRK